MTRPILPRDSQGFSRDEALISKLVKESTRDNGKRLMTCDEAEVLLRHHGLRSRRSAKHWEQRRVDAALRITYQGWHWSVADLPGVQVCALVECRLTRRGAFLRVRAASEAHAGILASRLELAHSHPHTPPPVGIEVNSGRQTTSREPAHQSASPSAPADRTPQTPQAASREARKHSRNVGTADVAPVVCSISIELAPAPAPVRSPASRKKGRNRPRVSLRISIDGL